MTDLEGTGALVRLILRRDRIRIFIWVAGIVLLVALTATSVRSLFPTQAAIDQAAAATQHNAGAIAFNGPAQGLDTLGGQVAFQVGALGMVIVALMSLFMIGRLTRGDEEAGRLELIRSLPVGIDDPTNGLYAPTQYTKGASADIAYNDGVRDIMLGRRAMGEYDQILQDWRTAAGDQVRTGAHGRNDRRKISAPLILRKC